MSLLELAPNNACTPLRCYRSPNAVTLNITYGFPRVCFFSARSLSPML